MRYGNEFQIDGAACANVTKSLGFSVGNKKRVLIIWS